jgi:hypothetical protein
MPVLLTADADLPEEAYAEIAAKMTSLILIPTELKARGGLMHLKGR